MTNDRTRDPLDGLLQAGEGSLDAADERIARSLLALRSLDDGVSATVANDHLTVITAAAVEHAHDAPAPVAAAAGRWRRRGLQVLGATGAKLVLTGAVALATTGGLAATDRLPDPIQRAVSDAASSVGIDLPHPDRVKQAIDEAKDERPGPGEGKRGIGEDVSDTARGGDTDGDGNRGHGRDGVDPDNPGRGEKSVQGVHPDNPGRGERGVEGVDPDNPGRGADGSDADGSVDATEPGATGARERPRDEATETDGDDDADEDDDDEDDDREPGRPAPKK